MKQVFSLYDVENDQKSGIDVISDIENKEEVRRLEKFLQYIPAKQREVFILRAMDGLSYKEISEITGRSEGGLKSNYFHALRKLTEMMKNE